MSEKFTNQPEIWGGIECTYNRVGDAYRDQLESAGFYDRPEDIDRLAGLGIKKLRYPAIWEKHQPEKNAKIDWTFTASRLDKIKQLGVEPIVGLVHHGSGPAYASFFDGSFEEGLAAFALAFANRFPEVEYYTPVNEPLTTARFCGLYGHWFPHEHSDRAFLQILLSECRAVVLSMQAVRTVNPGARLVQTDDLGKTHSTIALDYQARFENNRRWLTFDLLCGNLSEHHCLYPYLLANGVEPGQLEFFRQHPCPPDIIGINHYLTSERWLDENTGLYPPHTWGGNGHIQYADVEAVRVSKPVVIGPYGVLKEAWERYELPIAVTEVHLHCTREEQLRWFGQVYENARQLKKEGADIRAVTAWAVFGSFDWCSLLTRCDGIYEPGLFDVRAAEPRPTALTKLVKELSQGAAFNHPVMEEEGWWKRDCRIIYELDGYPRNQQSPPKHTQPLIIIGKHGALAKAFARLCALRGIQYMLVGKNELEITNEKAVTAFIQQHRPWALLNTAGFVKVDEAETNRENCFLVNTLAPQLLSLVCSNYGVKFTNFSSDLVFNGEKRIPYLESDLVSPLNVYGQSKARAEELVLQNNSESLIIRTSSFFGPWDEGNFVHRTLKALQQHQFFNVASDVTISPTYVPDLANTTLDLLIDGEKGIWNLSNKGEVTWAMLAGEIANRGGFSPGSFKAVLVKDMQLVAERPQYSVLTTEKGLELPSLENALGRFFHEQRLLAL